jgi:hypothetical protein
MKQTSNATPSVKKRKKVAAGAEVITANEVLSRLAKDKEEKDKKETKKRGKEATKIPKMTKKTTTTNFCQLKLRRRNGRTRIYRHRR